MPTALIYALFAGILPSLIWLWFWVREDHVHPEPRTLIAATFLGGAVAVFMAVIGEKYVAEFVSDTVVKYAAWAAVEEIVKFLAIGAIALRAAANDEPIDAMIYCITAALGFAAIENTLFILGPLSNGDITQSLVTGNMRFMGATLVHVISSAFVGFALGISFYRGYATKIFMTVIGLGIAIVLHTAFNLSILQANSMDTLSIFSWIWGAVVILIILFEEVKVVRPKLL